ncbi:MAG: hypothetical protein A3I44_03655 [Candidatus Sungbacteria bacterium RIFCSPLOWO2_02_FULL_51_17]|uniref:HTH arsR-type domain-containing protein n=1 Tax=Candidatus Sungbacteria bacterium RIFCSPHIGHO2_02_FULL_51_29 TaxID=1802273 RepID=A0A1G2KQV2_9BACT|nr:MAG: hypothetical protein A2676_03435 [Candidatus Sungbacteria bacterium RIFCSPHIGHO2_01_FULL_51_22]OHA01808.1 MAG: hypothetical protein A3C16_05840 [Candidatus Sungbacteria bacterium RIFCSPHIGHO2_02_FULL_51_29]OHA07197.1 MAG: hypothetical protein A3B29_00460 [Candidatus Sungbacteria bacterium RIFCSPLOWO2_01_FULL_51_34]OHA10483.1 MAG: hypothetical protein A3I44_03655 [Candidatus Sungbacteria bacterium RIFCSPLOWO2_02_FULL_51_17]
MKERHLEKIVKALANRRRLAIMRYLKAEKEATVGDIAGAIKLSFKATSKHLQILSSADVVERNQRGLSADYHLSPEQNPVVRALISIL